MNNRPRAGYQTASMERRHNIQARAREGAVQIERAEAVRIQERNGQGEASINARVRSYVTIVLCLRIALFTFTSSIELLLTMGLVRRPETFTLASFPVFFLYFWRSLDHPLNYNPDNTSRFEKLHKAFFNSLPTFVQDYLPEPAPQDTNIEQNPTPPSQGLHVAQTLAWLFQLFVVLALLIHAGVFSRKLFGDCCPERVITYVLKSILVQEVIDRLVTIVCVEPDNGPGETGDALAIWLCKAGGLYAVVNYMTMAFDDGKVEPVLRFLIEISAKGMDVMWLSA